MSLCRPTFRGALYDYYLVATGGYFGVRAALTNDVAYETEKWLMTREEEAGGRSTEAAVSVSRKLPQVFAHPLHVQLNPATLCVTVVNALPCASPEAEVHVSVVAMNGSTVLSRTFTTSSLPANAVATFPEALSVPGRVSEGTVLIYSLLLLSHSVIDRRRRPDRELAALCDQPLVEMKEPRVVRRQSYWLPYPSPSLAEELAGADYRSLQVLRRNTAAWISMKGTSSCSRGDDSMLRIDLSLWNDGSAVAFAVEVTVSRAGEEGKGVDGDEDEDTQPVLPAFYSQNYFPVLAGDRVSMYVDLVVDPRQWQSDWVVLIEGWNVNPLRMVATCEADGQPA